MRPTKTRSDISSNVDCPKRKFSILWCEVTDKAAKKWKTLRDHCLLVEKLPPFDRKQIELHGLFDYLAFARKEPCVVVASGSDLQKHFDECRGKHPKQIPAFEYLRNDAYIVILTDKGGMDMADQYGLYSIPWEQEAQYGVIDRFNLFDKTSVLKGFSKTMQRVRQSIARAANDVQDVNSNNTLRRPVLILGESGSGKEMVARALHQAATFHEKAPLAQEAFEGVACGTLSKTLLLDQIFGHWRGAFNDAISHAAGILELFSDGTMLLDDLDAADDPLAVQGSLLRFLSTFPPKIKRLGHPPTEPMIKEDRQYIKNIRGYDARSQTIEVFTWLLVSTNKNLKELVEKGKLREDFLFRFKRRIWMPPLRDHPEDICQIAHEFSLALPEYRKLDIPALRWLRERENKGKGNAREIDALLLHAYELRQEYNLGWSDALANASANSSDYLDWGHLECEKTFESDVRDMESKLEKLLGIEKHSPIIPAWSTLKKNDQERFLTQLSAEIKYRSNKSCATWLELVKDKRRNGLCELLASAVKEYFADLQIINEFKKFLEKRENDNPLAIYHFIVLLYLVLCERHRMTRDDIKLITRLKSWGQSDNIVKNLINYNKKKPLIRKGEKEGSADTFELAQELKVLSK